MDAVGVTDTVGIVDGCETLASSEGTVMVLFAVTGVIATAVDPVWLLLASMVGAGAALVLDSAAR